MRLSAVATAIAFLLSWRWSYALEPLPVQVPVSTEWFGYDGRWSPVNMRVGSPPQWLSLLPSTLSQETWAIAASGCEKDSITCITKRGGVFNATESSTWDLLGTYALNFQPALGDNGPADYGLDTISIEEEIEVPNQIVGTLNTLEFFLGALGLGVTSSNFTSENQPTFLSSMVVNQSAIPSHSYGYTAGAYYQFKGVPCSLTLGGVDLNRIVPNDVSFILAPSQEPVVAINSISVSADPLPAVSTKPDWAEEPLSLMKSSQAEQYTIDSSTPFLWLPEKVCDEFALALNLTYNETLQLYLYGNGTDPEILKDWNLNFTFTLADLPGSSKSVDISLPFDAFNHRLSYPFPALNATASAPAVNYFPLRKAANQTQYTIGRTLLQEAYLAVDYERNNFSVSQARFTTDAITNVNLAAITRPPNSSFPGPASTSSGGLSTSSKIGIGIGAAVLALAILVILALVWRRRRRRSEVGPIGILSEKKGLLKRIAHGKTQGTHESVTPPTVAPPELPASNRHPREAPADESASRFELPGNPPVEMQAEVPSSYYALDKARGGANPAELDPQDPTSKDSIIHDSSRLSASPSLPPYSAAQVGMRSVGNTSPSSTSFPHGDYRGTGTQSSGISEVSPDSGSGNQFRRSSHRYTVRSSSAQEVSPAEPSPLTPTTLMDRRNTSSRPSLLPSPEGDNGTPSRSVSRSSRFREEGIAEDALLPQPLRPRKFSWEAPR